MQGKVLDGKAIAAEIRAKVKEDVARMQRERGITPGLAVILVGDDPASQIYVNSKKRACEEVGIYSRQYRLPADTSQTELLQLIHRLNVDPAIHGILVQLPLPAHLDEKLVIDTISPAKDVDVIHPLTSGSCPLGNRACSPVLPRGLWSFLRRTEVIWGRHTVVVGRSNIVANLPLLLLRENATVTICYLPAPRSGQ